MTTSFKDPQATLDYFNKLSSGQIESEEKSEAHRLAKHEKGEKESPDDKKQKKKGRKTTKSSPVTEEEYATHFVNKYIKTQDNIKLYKELNVLSEKTSDVNKLNNKKILDNIYKNLLEKNNAYSRELSKEKEERKYEEVKQIPILITRIKEEFSMLFKNLRSNNQITKNLIMNETNIFDQSFTRNALNKQFLRKNRSIPVKPFYMRSISGATLQEKYCIDMHINNTWLLVNNPWIEKAKLVLQTKDNTYKKDEMIMYKENWFVPKNKWLLEHCKENHSLLKECMEQFNSKITGITYGLHIKYKYNKYFYKPLLEEDLKNIKENCVNKNNKVSSYVAINYKSLIAIKVPYPNFIKLENQITNIEDFLKNSGILEKDLTMEDKQKLNYILDTKNQYGWKIPKTDWIDAQYKNLLNSQDYTIGIFPFENIPNEEIRPYTKNEMKEECEYWKRYATNPINKLKSAEPKLYIPFNHYIKSNYFNPTKLDAKLKEFYNHNTKAKFDLFGEKIHSISMKILDSSRNYEDYIVKLFDVIILLDPYFRLNKYAKFYRNNFIYFTDEYIMNMPLNYKFMDIQKDMIKQKPDLTEEQNYQDFMNRFSWQYYKLRDEEIEKFFNKLYNPHEQILFETIPFIEILTHIIKDQRCFSSKDKLNIILDNKCITIIDAYKNPNYEKLMIDMFGPFDKFNSLFLKSESKDSTAVKTQQEKSEEELIFEHKREAGYYRLNNLKYIETEQDEQEEIKSSIKNEKGGKILRTCSNENCKKPNKEFDIDNTARFVTYDNKCRILYFCSAECMNQKKDTLKRKTTINDLSKDIITTINNIHNLDLNIIENYCKKTINLKTDKKFLDKKYYWELIKYYDKLPIEVLNYNKNTKNENLIADILHILNSFCDILELEIEKITNKPKKKRQDEIIKPTEENEIKDKLEALYFKINPNTLCKKSLLELHKILISLYKDPLFKQYIIDNDSDYKSKKSDLFISYKSHYTPSSRTRQKSNSVSSDALNKLIFFEADMAKIEEELNPEDFETDNIYESSSSSLHSESSSSSLTTASSSALSRISNKSL